MPKNTKSSASSATRKKQAAKAAKKAGTEVGSSSAKEKTSESTGKALQRGQKKEKGKKGKPKKKVYVPPVKPKADVLDPLDSMGLASLLPAELVLLLRKASKKDITTRIRALEGLLQWIDEDDEKTDVLIVALPSWAHLFPRLTVSPNRRLRQLTVQISVKLMENDAVFDEFVAQPVFVESVLGPLLVVAHGNDRLVSRTALSLFESRTTWKEGQAGRIDLNEYTSSLVDHLASILFHVDQSNNEESRADTVTSGSSTPLGVAREAKNREDGNVEEDASGTDGRLVSGAIEGISWIVQARPPKHALDSLAPILNHPTTWTSLSPKSLQGRSLGSLSPSVRIAAWALVRTLVMEWNEGIDKYILLLGPQALTSCFEEDDVLVAQTMRESIVRLLRLRPAIWKMRLSDDNEENEQDDDDEVEDEDDENSDVEHERDESDRDQEAESGHTTHYNRFAALNDYLRKGVCGIASSYGIVILLLATIPDDVFPASTSRALDVLYAMYAPKDEGTFEGREVERAFVSAFLECVVWLTGRVATRASNDEALKVVNAMEMLWVDYVDAASDGDQEPACSVRSSNRKILGEDRLVKDVGVCLRKVGGIQIELAQPILRLARLSFERALSVRSTPIELVCRILSISTESEQQQEQQQQKSPITNNAVLDLIRDVTFTTANVVASGEAVSQGTFMLTLLLRYFPFALQNEECLHALSLAFRRTLQDRSSISSSEEAASFMVSFVVLHRDEEEKKTFWIELMDAMVGTEEQLDWSLLRAVWQTTVEKGAPVFDVYSDRLLKAFAVSFRSNISVSAHLIANPASIIRPDLSQRLLGETLKDAPTSSSSSSSTTASDWLVLETWLKADPDRVKVFLDTPELASTVPRIFFAASFLSDRRAFSIWSILAQHDAAIRPAVDVLQAELEKLDRPLSSIFEANKLLGSHATLSDLLPSPTVWKESFETSCSVAMSEGLPSLLCIHDDLVPLTSPKSIPQARYDVEGFSAEARRTILLLAAVEEGLMEKDVWLLPNLINFAIAAEDGVLEAEGGARCFAENVSKVELERFLLRSVSLSTSILSSTAAKVDGDWFASLTKVLHGQQEPEDELQSVLRQVWTTPGAARVFARLLKGSLNFSGASESDALLLLRLAQSTKKEADFARSIYFSIKEMVLETPLYERLRNQTAAELAGVKAINASQQGLELLRTLVALSPPLDASVSLIPQQRCIFLLQTLQSWFASDEDLPTEIYTRLAQLFLPVLPIVQDMPGTHLDLVVDVIEMNLADADLSEHTGIVNVYHTLVLLDSLIELAERSAVLRDMWKDRRKDVYQAFHQLVRTLVGAFSSEKDFGLSKAKHRQSYARLCVEDAVVDILRRIPPTLFKDDIGLLINLLQVPADSSLPVVAYRLLSQLIREQVKELVVEAAVGSKRFGEEDGSMHTTHQALKEPLKLRLPDELVVILDQPESFSETTVLLAWLATFEYFEEGSMELRAAYSSQLQTAQVISTRLIPALLARLTPTNEPGKWALDELFLDDVDGRSTSIDVLTVHVFYRALIHTPNLVCDAFFAIKDRQQSMLLRNLTVRNLTPLLAQREFGHLRHAEVLDRLQDENMQIKVLANISEVVATYTVDEYPLEIAISMPTDYPLHPIEVRDLRKIGISEGTWRAWLLGMRQLIAGRNGLIFDALLLFKRNVEAKFSGYDEDSTCAICYSIVSPTDHSLPTKPCKTCKKKFHASCLYKWVSTSGSSTCPMCRSLL